MATGYMGKFLHVDLSQRTIRIEAPEANFYRTYMGCRGFGYDYLMRRLPAGLDAFDPRQLLVFATGVMTGAPIPAACRFAVIGKSPLTGTAAESETGGFFGPELKKAGFDGIVIQGRADSPVWLRVDDDAVRICDAAHFAEQDSKAVEDAIRSEMGSAKVRVAQTGLAGMNRVLYANITNNLAHFNGRNGLGALMGAKNLRAVAVLGTGRIPWSDADVLKENAARYGKISPDLPISKSLFEYGTTAFAAALSNAGALPVDNFRRSALDDPDSVSGDTYNRVLLKKRKGCYLCPIRCKRQVALEHPQYGLDSRYGGPEYETIAALGTNLNITDLRAIAKANEICSRYCMDTISAGMTIAFACECYEKGIITKADTDGLVLRFGNPDLVIDLLEKTARREGFGDLLAEGTARLARKWGVGDAAFNLTAGGQELPMHDPRVKVMVGLGYTVSTHGADHMNAPHDTMFADPESPGLKSVAALGIEAPMTPTRITNEGVATYVKLDEVYKIMDTLGLCVFGFAPRGSMPLDTLVACLRAVSGWDVTLEEMATAARRGSLLARAFNFREGVGRAQLPRRLFDPKPDGPQAGETIFDKAQYESAVQQYYQLVGIDPETLRPTSAALRELGLDWVEGLLKR